MARFGRQDTISWLALGLFVAYLLVPAFS
jgi:hypothetical protein